MATVPRALGHGDGDLAAGQELGRLAREADEVRLGQDLDHAVLLQGIDEQAEIVVAALDRDNPA